MKKHRRWGGGGAKEDGNRREMGVQLRGKEERSKRDPEVGAYRKTRMRSRRFDLYVNRQAAVVRRARHQVRNTGAPIYTLAFGDGRGYFTALEPA